MFKFLALFGFLFLHASPISYASEQSVAELKAAIVTLAKSYEGQGDPDQSKQRSLEVLVQKLLAKKDMPPIAQRISTLAGVWKQVWGPYDYRNDNGGVDPSLGVKEIYQVVSADGYYYNVSPLYSGSDQRRERIGLLRGKYQLDSKDPNTLRVKFVRYPGVERRPEGLEIWELAPLAESGKLPDETTIVSSWIVRLFFGGGKLEEVYTDQDLRLTFGSSARPGSRRSLYVMSRVP